ncbi:MAG: ABC transporter substrate-binding protein [Spirochaetaceae bacterium]
MKRALLLFSVLLILALLAACGPGEEEAEEEAEEEEATEIQNPNTYVYGGIGDPDSLDPAKAYDSASWEVMTNVYETLIDFDREATDEYVPVLATEVPTRENGGISEDGRTYRFEIRDDVTFHNGNELTPEDVEYTFERNMVVDADGGPNWVWYTYLLGMDSSADVESFDQIDEAVEVDGDYVVFNLQEPFPPFLSVIASTWASIVNKEWVIENDGWDGTAETWEDYNKPEEGKETLYEIANGTGPYELTRWEKDTEVVLDRYEDYWDELPEMERGIVRVVKEWSTRRLQLTQGDLDAAYVPETHYGAMLEEEGLTAYEDLPTLQVTGIHFNYEIDTSGDNPLVGSGELDGEGIPSDFFQDKDVREGFRYAFDVDALIDEALDGNARDPVTPIPYGLPFKNEDLESPEHDMELAEEHLRQAHDGELWENGFEFEILYNEGNDTRQIASNIMAENIGSLNENFEIETRAVPWAEFLDQIRNSSMPMFVIGWLPDYPDADNFVTPFMHSKKGTFSAWAHYENERVDELIDAAGKTLDEEERREMYYELQDIYLEDVTSIMINQPLLTWFFQDYVQGVHFNPMYSSEFELLPYISKE